MVGRHRQEKIHDAQRDTRQVHEFGQLMLHQDRENAGERLTTQIQRCIYLGVNWYSLEQYIGFEVRQAFNYYCSLHYLKVIGSLRSVKSVKPNGNWKPMKLEVLNLIGRKGGRY